LVLQSEVLVSACLETMNLGLVIWSHTTDYEVKSANDNDNEKRLGLTAKADQPDHKKYSTLKIKIDNEAVQKLHTS